MPFIGLMRQFLTLSFLIICLILWFTILTQAVNNSSEYIHESNRTHHLHLDRRKGDNGGLKVLIICSDTRQIHHNLTVVQELSSHYFSITSVLQSDYAALNGYDYLKLYPIYNTTSSDDILSNYSNIYHTFRNKNGKTIYNNRYKEFRVSPWSKVAFIWNVTKDLGQYYDYIWFFDSDATINPHYNNISLSDQLKLYQSQGNESISWGSSNITNSNFIFFSNFPYRDDLPCTGIILINTKPTHINNTLIMLQEWWNFHIPTKNAKEFCEQDALWHILENSHLSEYNFSMNLMTVSVLLEPQFPSEWYGLNDLWLCHIANFKPYRFVLFKHL